jgi:hypothetical protein
MNKVIDTIKNNSSNIKKVLYIVLGLVVLYYAILVLTPKPQLPADIQAKLDSLDKVTKVLEQQQKVYDSTIREQEEVIARLDFQIDNVKEKTTIVKEYYHEQSTAVSNFNHSQLDSFFAARYGY